MNNKMILIGVLSCFAMPAMAEQSPAAVPSPGYEESFDFGALDGAEARDLMMRPGGPGRGGPGHGGIGRGGPGRGGHPGGGIGNGPRRPGNPGGGIGNGPRRPGNPGGIGQGPRRPHQPGHPGGGIGNGPRRPHDPGHIGGGNRFPGRGQWGQGPRWWRDRYGSGWYGRFRWWPGFGYSAGACFAQDDEGYLFAGRTGSRAVYNCEDNSRAGGCEFVGCD